MLMNTEQLPSLNATEIIDFEKIIQAAKNQVEPEQQKIQEKYVELEAPKLVEAAKKKGGDLSLDDAKKTVRARCEGGKHRDLYRDDVLNFDKYGPVIVGDVLKDFKKYDQATVCDPQELELGRSKGKLYLNTKEQKPCVNSFVHGGVKYFLHSESAHDVFKQRQSSQDLNWNFEDAICHITHIAAVYVNDDPCSVSRVFPIIEDILKNQTFSPLEMGIVRDHCKKHLKIAKGALDAVIKNDAQRNWDTKTENATHMEISDFFIDELKQQYLKVVGSENSLWVFGGDSTDGLFKKYDLIQAEINIARKHNGFKNCKKGPDYKAIAHLAYNSNIDVNFFRDAPYGLPGKTHFYQIAENGVIAQPYSAALKLRWKLNTDPAETYRPEKAPIFQRYLDYVLDDHQKQLLQEVIGALVTGCMSSLQKAVLLLGGGDNGKSVLLDLLTYVFHPDLRCSIKPDKMSEDYFKAMLAGKIINIIGEIDDTKPIKSDFKDIIAADTPLTARMPYAPPFEFFPQAGHIFSSNAFPMTKDHTHGFYRRWVIIKFSKKVTPNMKIPRLGKKIAMNEMAQFLSWGIEGAKRLIKNNFKLSETKQHFEQMEKWQNVRDSVFNFLNDDEAVQYITGAAVHKQTLYKAYSAWTRDNAGVRAVGRNTFYDRAELKLKEVRVNGKRAFSDIALKEWQEGGALLPYSANSPDQHYSLAKVPF